MTQGFLYETKRENAEKSWKNGFSFEANPRNIYYLEILVSLFCIHILVLLKEMSEAQHQDLYLVLKVLLIANVYIC